METRRLITAFLAAMVAFYVWTIVASYIWPHPHLTTQPVATAPAESQPSEASTHPAAELATTQPALEQSRASTLPAEFRLGPEGSTQRVRLGDASASSPYPMGLEIDPRGAAVASAQVRGQTETVADKTPYWIIKPALTSDGERLYAFSTSKIRFDNLK